MRSFKTMFVALALLSTSAMAQGVASAQSSLDTVSDEYGHVVSISSLTPYINIKQIDNDTLKTILNEANLQAKLNPLMISPFVSSAYGHAWSYIQQNSTGINCYAYSIKFPSWINPGDGDGISDIQTQAQLDNYFSSVNVVANKVIADGNTNPLYFKNPWRILSSKTATISSDEHRIALRIGYHDNNGNGHVDLNNNEADYHFMVQTDNGSWAEKHGQQPSINDGFIDPSNFNWNLDSYVNFYNSSTVYIAAKVY